jgi:hypothetical protein
MNAIARLVLALGLGVTCLGCAFAPAAARGRSPLSPIKPPVETAALEVVFVRHPYDVSAWNDDLWKEVDDLLIPADVRHTLAQNGFRAGVISGALPATLASALPVDAQRLPENGAVTGSSSGAEMLDSEPFVRRRTLHAPPGQRSELLASGIAEKLPVLIREGRETHGKVYEKAQCAFALTATPSGDGRVRLNLLPEVHHGDPRQEIRGEDGVFRWETGRPHVAFENMAIDVQLMPGQSILLGMRTERPGSLGHNFFSESRNGQLDQKLMLIRFDGTKFDNLLLQSVASPTRTPASGFVE